MDNVTYDKTKKTNLALPDSTIEMPSWLLEMTEYVWHYSHIQYIHIICNFSFLKINCILLILSFVSAM